MGNKFLCYIDKIRVHKRLNSLKDGMTFCASFFYQIFFMYKSRSLARAPPVKFLFFKTILGHHLSGGQIAGNIL